MRSPGFEPGSSTWQADVLNQARLRPLTTSLRHFSIVEVLLKLKSSGLSEGSLRTISDNLKHLSKHCDLADADSVRDYVAQLSNVPLSFSFSSPASYGLERDLGVFRYF